MECPSCKRKWLYGTMPANFIEKYGICVLCFAIDPEMKIEPKEEVIMDNKIDRDSSTPNGIRAYDAQRNGQAPIQFSPNDGFLGLTKRELFAAIVMQGLAPCVSMTEETTAKCAVKMADELLLALQPEVKK